MTNDELIKLLNNKQTKQNYENNYNTLVEESKIRGLNKSRLGYYTEKHHIIPKCMGGKDEDDNYVLLTYQEHVIAHILLYLINPNNIKLFCAARLMINYCDKNLTKLNNLSEKDVKNFLSYIKIVNGKRTVCYDLRDFTVLKIYNSRREISEELGIEISTIKDCIRGNYSNAGGYGVSDIDDFMKNHEDKLIEFQNSSENNITLHRLRGKGKNPFKQREIVSLDSNNNIVGVLNSVFDIETYGGNNSTLYNNIVNGINSYGGLNWKFSADCDENKIAEFKKKYGNNILTVQLSFSKKIVSIKNNTLIKIYKSAYEAAEDILCDSSSIYKCLKGKLKHIGGYNFMYLEEASKYFSKAEIKNIELNSPTSIDLAKDYYSVVSVKDNKPIAIFESAKQAGDILNCKPNGIINCLNGKRKSSKGFKWIRLCDAKRIFQKELDYVNNYNNRK